MDYVILKEDKKPSRFLEFRTLLGGDIIVYCHNGGKCISVLLNKGQLLQLGQFANENTKEVK